MAQAGWVLFLALVLSGCGSSNPAGTGGFVALQGSFANYTSWRAFDLGTDTSDGVHTDGNRTVYVNQLPPHGSKVFPQGTILVKTIAAGTPQAGNTFAMAKRDGGFNSQGAAGWEWFELQGTPTTPLILWRGIAPPTTESYAVTTPDACNSCHKNADDAVFGDPLQLDQF